MVKEVMKWVAILIAAVAAVYVVRSFLQLEEQVKYLTEVIKRGNIHQTVSTMGKTPPSNLVAVGSQASGQVKKLYVRLGQQVKKDDLIVEINSTTQMNTFNTEKSKLGTYQVKLVSTETALDSTEEKYKREATLQEEKVTSKEDFENAQDTLAVAKANVVELKASIKQIKTFINVTESDLGYTRITAMTDSTVVTILVEEGQTVSAVQSTPTIIQPANLDTMLDKMQIAESNIIKVKTGQDAPFTVLSEPDEPIEARLDSVNPGLTAMSLGSYTVSTDTTSNVIYYYTRTLVSNPNGKLFIGTMTRNTIEISGVKDVLLVPTLTIRKRDDKSYVSTLGADSKAVEREITVGLEGSTNTEVKSGSKKGEKVVMLEMSVAEQVEAVQCMMKGGGPPR